MGLAVGVYVDIRSTVANLYHDFIVFELGTGDDSRRVQWKHRDIRADALLPSCSAAIESVGGDPNGEKHPVAAKFVYSEAPQASNKITVQITGQTVGDSCMVDFIFSSEQLHDPSVADDANDIWGITFSLRGFSLEKATQSHGVPLPRS